MNISSPSTSDQFYYQHYIGPTQVSMIPEMELPIVESDSAIDFINTSKTPIQALKSDYLEFQPMIPQPILLPLEVEMPKLNSPFFNANMQIYMHTATPKMTLTPVEKKEEAVALQENRGVKRKNVYKKKTYQWYLNIYPKEVEKVQRAYQNFLTKLGTDAPKNDLKEFSTQSEIIKNIYDGICSVSKMNKNYFGVVSQETFRKALGKKRKEDYKNVLRIEMKICASYFQDLVVKFTPNSKVVTPPTYLGIAYSLIDLYQKIIRSK